MAESNVALILQVRRMNEQPKRETRKRRIEIKQGKKRLKEDQGVMKQIRRQSGPDLQVLLAPVDDDGAAARRTINMIKEYKVITDPYDGTAEEFDRELEVMCGLVNFRLLSDEGQQ